MKIKLDGSGDHHAQITEIITAGFYRNIRRDYELPIERVIAELVGQIQANEIMIDGIPRYNLN